MLILHSKHIKNLYALFSRSRMMVLWPLKLYGCGGSLYIFYFFSCLRDKRIEWQCAGLGWSLDEGRFDCSQGFCGFSPVLFMNYHLAPYFEQIEHKEKQNCRAYRSVHPSRYEMKVRWVIRGYSRKGNKRRIKIAPLWDEWMKGRRRLTKPKGKAVERRMVTGMHVRAVYSRTQRPAPALFIYFWTWPFF